MGIVGDILSPLGIYLQKDGSIKYANDIPDFKPKSYYLERKAVELKSEVAKPKPEAISEQKAAIDKKTEYSENIKNIQSRISMLNKSSDKVGIQTKISKLYKKI